MAEGTGKKGGVSTALSRSRSKLREGSGSGGGDFTTECGPLTISGNFDSGNFLKAELVEPERGVGVVGEEGEDVSKSLLTSSSRPPLQDYEVNIWTRPDCYGTPFENGNRTWFHFGIKGGDPCSTVKINVINLNKQTKLFLQGMAPVFRILPEKPAWERIRDKVVLIDNKTSENGCSITFRQRLPDNPQKSTLFIAFTYPFSYLESCDLLKKMDIKFNPRSKSSPCALSLHLPLSRGVSKDLKAFKFLPDNEVYYHRECLCYSLEGKRVDLITISACNGISDEREERLAKLFPIQDELRSFKFPNKKVVFLSARVHPGETPSSFVLNGFIKFVLDKADSRAVLLRRYFVFKIIPILNPDGVVKGHYRTDPRGVNLNRMYLNPSVDLHPSIYAARKLLMYYHNGTDAPDPATDEQPEFPVENAVPSSSQEDLRFGENSGPISGRKKIRNKKSGTPRKKLGSSVSSSEGDSEAAMQVEEQSPVMKPKLETSPDPKKPYKFVLNDANSLCAGCVPFEDENAGPPSCSSSAGCLTAGAEKVPDEVCVSLMREAVSSSLHQCAFEACDEDSVFYENLRLNNEMVCNTMDVDLPIAQEEDAICFPVAGTSTETVEEQEDATKPTARRRKKGVAKAKDRKKKVLPPRTSAINGSATADKSTGRKGALTKQKSLPMSLPKVQDTTSQARTTRRSSGSVWYKTSERYHDNSSGLFLYIDMHGHTTKRGIFMYGNHFPDINTQSECMLVPRLMAINSPHFDFAACNFTERLMCVKDRRDGASREGSGRVACLKLTGLIRSYTLECNYNTGRIVNPVVERPPSFGFTDPFTPVTFSPPKYTIDLFEGVGKALGESILDMTGQNPYSRLSQTEFRSLDGVKRSLVTRLKMSPEYGTPVERVPGKKVAASGSLSQSNYDSNPLLPQLSSVHKNKKLKSKVLLPSKSAGPLGPRRENQNNSPLAATLSIVKASGSQQLKKLPIAMNEVKTEDCPPIAGTSSAYNPLSDKTSNTRPKASLGKVVKKRSFPKFAPRKKGGTGKVKKKVKDKKTSEVANNNEQQSTATSTSTL